MKFEDNDNLPDSRMMLEHNAYVAVEMATNSKLHFSENARNHGLDKVRTLPNGRIDLHTINEGARTIMNMVSLPNFLE